jgi:hypothetical protein
VRTNGASITIETTFEGTDSPEIARSRSGNADMLQIAKNSQRVAERNVRIEENARWLADMLDVPFEGWYPLA